MDGMILTIKCEDCKGNFKKMGNFAPSGPRVHIREGLDSRYGMYGITMYRHWSAECDMRDDRPDYLANMAEGTGGNK